MTDDGEQNLVFLDEPIPQEAVNLPAWQILLVDDEPDVHAATQLALKGMQVQGRALAFSHAYSGAQALEMLSAPNEFAVAFIDVVMETGDAGLQLVRQIRQELNNQALRIILRTGQPGYAPEIDTIACYDINDYRTKSELTQVRLFTSLTMALRSYAQICQLEAGRNGLEQILAATTELGKPVGMNRFAAGLVTQLCALLDVDTQCLVCAAMHEPNVPPYVLAAAGPYSAWIGMPLQSIPEARVRDHLLHTLQIRNHHFDGGASLFFQGRNDQALAAFVDVPRPLESLEKGLLGVFCSNISVAFENLQLYLAINDLAYNDALVLLPNRNALAGAIDKPAPGQDTVALLDLDGFADINSILNASFGDAVLQAVARRLRSLFSTQTLVARLGSDLFGLHGPQSEVTPEAIAQVFAQPFVIDQGSEPLRLSATAGLVCLSDGSCGNETSGVAVLRNASAALKQAKRFARGKTLYFEASQADAARDRLHMLNRLRASFSEQHLFLQYQPLVDLASGEAVGAEALLRWKTPDGVFVPPDQFIPIAEQSGLMIALGEWVMRTAMKWRLGLVGHVTDDFRVAINVSHVQFAEPDFENTVLAILDEIGLQGNKIEIELTESVAIENMEKVVGKLDVLRTKGVGVAMDDFGTGYSSLSVLQRLKLDRLKIDRSFVSGSQTQFENFEIANTIITMARHLRLNTIAEGIETLEQRDAMRAAGCHEGQGYLFSRPLGENDFLAWLKNNKK